VCAVAFGFLVTIAIFILGDLIVGWATDRHDWGDPDDPDISLVWFAVLTAAVALMALIPLALSALRGRRYHTSREHGDAEGCGRLLVFGFVMAVAVIIVTAGISSAGLENAIAWLIWVAVPVAALGLLALMPILRSGRD
jgi:hypothetical protein